MDENLISKKTDNEAESVVIEENCSKSQKEIQQHSIRIEIASAAYNRLLKLSMQQGISVEKLVACSIQNLLQQNK